jgi:hypothetical protein
MPLLRGANSRNQEVHYVGPMRPVPLGQTERYPDYAKEVAGRRN